MLSIDPEEPPETTQTYPISSLVPCQQPTPQAPLISATSLPPPSSDSHRRLNTDTTLSSSSQTTDDVLSTDDTQVDIEK